MMYQISKQSQFQMTIVATTLEEATDVLYTRRQFCDEYNNGEDISGSCDSDMGECNLIVYDGYIAFSPVKGAQVKMLCVNNIIQHIKRNLKGKEPIEIIFDEDDEYAQHKMERRLNDLNKLFKLHGFRYRTKLKDFVVYKETKRKPKAKKADGVILHQLRGDTVTGIIKVIDKQFGTDLKSLSNAKRVQSGMVKMAHLLGLKREEVGPTTWRISSCSTMFDYLTKELHVDSDIAELTIIEYERWWDECIK